VVASCALSENVCRDGLKEAFDCGREWLRNHEASTYCFALIPAPEISSLSPGASIHPVALDEGSREKEATKIFSGVKGEGDGRSQQ